MILNEHYYQKYDDYQGEHIKLLFTNILYRCEENDNFTFSSLNRKGKWIHLLFVCLCKWIIITTPKAPH